MEATTTTCFACPDVVALLLLFSPGRVRLEQAWMLLASVLGGVCRHS